MGDFQDKQKTLTSAEAVALVTITSTSAELDDISSAINTTGKALGKMVFNTTLSYPVWAFGSFPGSGWANSAGVTIHAPS